jgi:hypothetical protein
VEREHSEAQPDEVPVFGSWPRIYLAVVLSAVTVMGLIGLFLAWEY